MTNPQDKKDEVRDGILSAARGLFLKYGLDKTTMEDIAEAAGKGKSTLYYYFSKKEDVFHALALQEGAATMEALEKGLRQAAGAAQKVKVFFTLQDSLLRSKVKLAPLVFRETGRHIDLIQRLQREANTRITNIFKSILVEGIESGEFRSIRKEDCDAIACGAVTTLHAMQLTLILDGKTPSEECRQTVMIDVFIRGLK